MVMWNPWRGCHRYSEGCQHCYIHKGDAKRGIDTNLIVKAQKQPAISERYKKGDKAGEYKVKSGETVYLCFSSDFLLPEADEWRSECWALMRERSDLHFVFLTKRIERLADCLPKDWGEGYDNVTVGCTVENQRNADYRLGIFDCLPIKHKSIICQPLLEEINIEQHLLGVELVMVGGEQDRFARPFHYAWVLALREQCLRHKISFNFRQCGSNFIKDGINYRLSPQILFSQARKADIDIHF